MPLSARSYPFGEAKYQSRMVDCYGFHTHDMLVISALAGTGDLAFEFEDERVVVGQETLVCFAPGDRHRALLAGEAEDYVIVHLDPEWIAHIYGIVARDVIWKRAVESALHHADFVRLVKDMATKEGADSAEFEEWLWGFLETSVVGIKDQQIPNAQLEAIRAHIVSAWNDPLSLENLAGEFGLNHYAVIRQFRRHYGTTPKQYQINLRVHHAKSMIAEGMAIAEAALNCGFYDQSHLYNYFKKIFGVSPKAYQEAFRT